MSQIKILDNVEGFTERRNTVAYQPPAASEDTLSSTLQHQVVIFPGDIQDFATVMMKNHSCRDYVEWSYEATLKRFALKFPNCHLCLVKPSKKAYNCVCIYNNFVESQSLMGSPLHSFDFNGLIHLELLIRNVRAQLNLTNPVYKTILVGFSKGCVVLNQILYELSKDHSQSATSLPSLEFVKSLLAMVWLDGGHSGDDGAWVTDGAVISALANQNFVNIYFSIHVTPYQVRDEHRPWKREEMVKFIELLRERKMSFYERLYFEDEAKSITNHFKILSDFDSSHILKHAGLSSS